LGVQLHDVLGKAKSVTRIVQARQAVTWAMHEQLQGASWGKMAGVLLRDHTTLMYSAGRFAKALESGSEWALTMRAELDGRVAPLVGLETALDSLRSCPGIDLSTAVEFEFGAVG
jgi:hypothetical protein